MQLDEHSGCGVIYAVAGQHYFEEAKTSILSLRRHHETLPVSIFLAGERDMAAQIMAGIPAIDLVDLERSVIEEGYDLAYKMEASRCLKTNVILKSPYRFNLFLDTDTFIKRPIEDIFLELGCDGRADFVDLVTTSEPITDFSTGTSKDGRPQSNRLKNLSNLYYFNSGVFAFRSELNDLGFGSEWRDVFRNQAQIQSDAPGGEWKRLCDQTAFNTTISRFPDLKRKTLTNTIWNAQCKILNELINQGKFDDIRIIHCKIVHALGELSPEALQKNPYISSFSIEDSRVGP